jgi:cob(I)alamin adenosyltransferase
MPRITKVTTHLGDKGFTYLANKEKVIKSCRRIRALGEVDELNAIIGIVRALTKNSEINYILKKIQGHLFLLGAQLAHPKPPDKYPKIEERHLKFIENTAEKINMNLQPLEEFILPGGTLAGAFLHFARTVARRAERSVVHLIEKEHSHNLQIKYLNRLSDLLFILARYINKIGNSAEEQINFTQLYQEE